MIQLVTRPSCAFLSRVLDPQPAAIATDLEGTLGMFPGVAQGERSRKEGFNLLPRRRNPARTAEEGSALESEGHNWGCHCQSRCELRPPPLSSRSKVPNCDSCGSLLCGFIVRLVPSAARFSRTISCSFALTDPQSLTSCARLRAVAPPHSATRSPSTSAPDIVRHFAYQPSKSALPEGSDRRSGTMDRGRELVLSRHVYVVFTLPPQPALVARQNKKVVDGLSQHLLRPETSVPQRLPAEQGARPRRRLATFPEEKTLLRCAL